MVLMNFVHYMHLRYLFFIIYFVLLHHSIDSIEVWTWMKPTDLRFFIIESLAGDMHTGQNLYDYLRQRSVDYADYMFDATYLSVYDKETLHETMRNIGNEVEANNDIPIIQIEWHGDPDYILLSSKEHVGWIELFDLTRPVNIVAHNSLLLNLSMCNGNAVIKEIDPKNRAPFRAVIGPLGEVNCCIMLSRPIYCTGRFPNVGWNRLFNSSRLSTFTFFYSLLFFFILF